MSVPSDRRYDPFGGGDAEGLRTVGHHDLGGFGDGMQVIQEADALYVGHSGATGMGTSILDASRPDRLRMVQQWKAPAGTSTHRVQAADGLLLVNHEQSGNADPFSAGMAVYDLSDPFDPQQVGWFHSPGRGVHRILWTGGDQAYVSAAPEGFHDRIWLVVDMRDPTAPVETGRWWWPGQWVAGGEVPTWPDGRRYAAHHALVEGDLAYLGYGDGGLVVLDIADPTAPRHLADLQWSPGGGTHTCLPLPGRSVLVVSDEADADRSHGEQQVRVVDVSEPALPSVRSVCPSPRGDFCTSGLRVGPHNVHQNRAGTYRSADVVFVTYSGAGLRVYDLSDADTPTEIAHWIPPAPPGREAPQIDDVFVGADLDIYVTDRGGGGVFALRPDDALARRLRAAAL